MPRETPAATVCRSAEVKAASPPTLVKRRLSCVRETALAPSSRALTASTACESLRPTQVVPVTSGVIVTGTLAWSCAEVSLALRPPESSCSPLGWMLTRNRSV